MHLIQKIASLDDNVKDNLLKFLRDSNGDPLLLLSSDLMSQAFSDKSSERVINVDYVRDELIRNCITDDS